MKNLESKHTPFTSEQVDAFFKADKHAKGIVDHEFEQSVIDRCEPGIQEMNQRIISGQTTWEEEEEKLLKLWKQLQQK